ncbi:hypothetical protein T459_03622 [Capsicum annuum]|uniref:WAT1-related protein n=1 Tax=Capsicum annuum TaxID=4072 RepID=A0A2G3ANF3_CAPAN|nr:hypothetical protein FXO37_31350 [Capsicum annuum]PHT95740.1 hypothetical protein T459_03622 [Capsicum annuum]
MLPSIIIFTHLSKITFTDRSEQLSLHRASGKAKVLGIIVSVIGAMIMTFYKGRKVPIKMHLLHYTTATGSKTENMALGVILAMLSCLSYSLWMVLLVNDFNYTFHFSLFKIMCFDLFYYLPNPFFIGKSSDPYLHYFLSAKVINGSLVGSGVVVILMTWCSLKRGPLFVSTFNPVTLLFVALSCVMLLSEALYVGSVLGGGLIIARLYLVLWGKEKEQKTSKSSNPKDAQHDIEVLTVEEEN